MDHARMSLELRPKAGVICGTLLWLALAFGGWRIMAATTEDCLAPKQVSVLPVFLVPKDEAPPTEDLKARLLRHLTWAQRRYAELLPGRKTFAIAPGGPVIVAGKFRGADYKDMPEGAAPQFVSEVLEALHLTRFNAPYSFFIVVMNTRNYNPGGGARTLNGGFNTGPGMVEMSSLGLDKSPNVQSTVQHELGHSFGLPHVDVYGYDMSTNASIMSYNPGHHTDGFNPSPTPGILIPEDIRGLALNQRAFPGLSFDPRRDVPAGYQMAPVICLGPQIIPGQPPYEIKGTTPSGEAYGSSLSWMLRGVIKPSSATTAANTFDPYTMWHSEKAPSGWVSCDLTFPVPVTLTRITVYSQHSGQCHKAEQARVWAGSKKGFRQVGSTKLSSPDSAVEFPAAKAQVWRLELQAGPSGMVVLRGLRFFHGENEMFPRPYLEID
jgi:hypothetical protein